MASSRPGKLPPHYLDFGSRACSLPRVVADGPLADAVLELLAGKVEVLPWEVALQGSRVEIAGLYTYGHPKVDGAMMDRLSGLR